MTHLHTIRIRGIKTNVGPPIPEGEGHYHLFGDNERTSTDPGGLGHQHNVGTVLTSIEIPLPELPDIQEPEN